MTETSQNTPRTIGLCSTCGTRPTQPGQRKCKECHADYMRGWRLKATTIRLEDPNYERLRRRAFITRISMSKLINESIEFRFAMEDLAERYGLPADGPRMLAELERVLRDVSRETKP